MFLPVVRYLAKARAMPPYREHAEQLMEPRWSQRLGKEIGGVFLAEHFGHDDTFVGYGLLYPTISPCYVLCSPVMDISLREMDRTL